MPVWITRLRLRLRALFLATHDRELRDELDLHIDLLADQFVEQGLSPHDARARAHREFGNLTRVHEQSHALFSMRAIETIVKDVSYAWREMRRSPVFTAVAVLSLAVGLGTATAAFAVIDALMLRGLPVPHPERLVAFSSATSASWSRWTYGAFRQWADAADAPFQTAAIFDINEAERPSIHGIAEARLGLVSGNYFAVLGAGVAAGRVLTASDDEMRATPVAVISHGFMERRFGATAAIIGRPLEINGTLYQVIGVTRKGFSGDWVGQPIDIWLPLRWHAALFRTGAPLDDASPARRLRVIARLDDGITLTQATAFANLSFARFLSASSASGSARPPGAANEITLLSAARGYAPLRQRYAQPAMIVSAIIALLMVIASANFVTLLHGRSQSRQREFAVRLVLGAGRWRIIRQALTECLVLAGFAALLAALISWWAATAVLKQFAATIQPVDINAAFDARLLMFMLGCVGLVMLFGLIPSLKGAGLSASLHLSQAATRERGRNIGGRLMAVGQLAVCAVLLLASGLMLRTVANLRFQHLGFDRNVLLLTLAPGTAGDRGDAARMSIDRIREWLLAIGDVRSVSTTSAPMLDSRAYWVESSEGVVVDGRPALPGVRWTFADVGADFFATMGMPLVRGRDFNADDFNSSSDATIINHSLAQLLFGDDDPIGRRVAMSASSPQLLIVGVVHDARQTSPRDRGLGVMYRPLTQPRPHVVLVVRTTGPAAATVVRHQLNAIGHATAIVKIQTIEELLNAAIGEERLLATLSTWLAVLVIIVACVGLHSLVANDVAERTQEMGIRVAFGATCGRVTWLVLRDCTTLVALAVCLGIPLSVAIIRPMSSQLYGVSLHDPQTLAGVVVLLMAVATIAAVRPARVAARVDPIVLLRAD